MDVAVVPSAIATIVDNSDVKRNGDAALAAAAAAEAAENKAHSPSHGGNGNGNGDEKRGNGTNGATGDARDSERSKPIVDSAVIKAIAARDAFQQQLASLRAIGVVRAANRDVQQQALQALFQEPELILQMLASAIPSIPTLSQAILANRLAPFVPALVGKDRLPDAMLQVVFRYFDTKTILTILSRVSSVWRRLAHTGSTHQHVRCIGQCQLLILQDRVPDVCHHATSLDIKCGPKRDKVEPAKGDRLAAFVNRCTKLTKLAVEWSNDLAGILPPINTRGLTYVNISGAILPKMELTDVVTLLIDHCDFHHSLEVSSVMERVSITDTVLYQPCVFDFSPSYKTLKEIEMRGLHSKRGQGERVLWKWVPQPSFTSVHHPHPLTYTPNVVYDTCGHCQAADITQSYHCKACEYNLCLRCFSPDGGTTVVPRMSALQRAMVWEHTSISPLPPFDLMSAIGSNIEELNVLIPCTDRPDEMFTRHSPLYSSLHNGIWPNLRHCTIWYTAHSKSWSTEHAQVITQAAPNLLELELACSDSTKHLDANPIVTNFATWSSSSSWPATRRPLRALKFLNARVSTLFKESKLPATISAASGSGLDAMKIADALSSGVAVIGIWGYRRMYDSGNAGGTIGTRTPWLSIELADSRSLHCDLNVGRPFRATISNLWAYLLVTKRVLAIYIQRNTKNSHDLTHDELDWRVDEYKDDIAKESKDRKEFSFADAWRRYDERMARGTPASASCTNDNCICHIPTHEYPDWSTLRRQRHWCGPPMPDRPDIKTPQHAHVLHMCRGQYRQCDLCKASAHNVPIYFCEPCNFDMCEACYKKDGDAVVVAREEKAKPSSPSSSTAAAATAAAATVIGPINNGTAVAAVIPPAAAAGGDDDDDDDDNNDHNDDGGDDLVAEDGDGDADDYLDGADGIEDEDAIDDDHDDNL